MRPLEVAVCQLCVGEAGLGQGQMTQGPKRTRKVRDPLLTIRPCLKNPIEEFCSVNI